MSGCRKVNGVHRKRYLGFGGRVTHPEGLKEVGKGQSQVGAGSVTTWVGVSFQHEGLRYVTQGFFDSLGSNLPTFPKESSTSPGGKSQEELALDRVGRIAQPRICSTIGAILLPPVPAGGSSGSINRCIVKQCPCSVKITLESCAGGGLARCQNLSFMGTKLSKCVRNAWLSSNWVIACNAILAKLISDPATCVHQKVGFVNYFFRW